MVETRDESRHPRERPEGHADVNADVKPEVNPELGPEEGAEAQSAPEVTPLAVTAPAVTSLGKEARSVNVIGTGTVASVIADGWTWDGRGSQEQLVFVEAPTNADTLTVQAGDRPPAQESALGGMTFAVGANEGRLIRLVTAQHLKRTGKIVATATQATTRLQVVNLNPRGH